MKKSPFLSVSVCAAALFLAACSRSTSDEQARAIENNLQQYYLAGQQYLLETGKPEARFADLVGPNKNLLSIKPANGESYDALVVTTSTKALTVKATDGREITFAPQ